MYADVCTSIYSLDGGTFCEDIIQNVRLINLDNNYYYCKSIVMLSRTVILSRLQVLSIPAWIHLMYSAIKLCKFVYYA